MPIGTQIRKIREAKGIKQSTMAQYLDMSQANYCKLERGDTQLKLNDLYKIAEYLQTDVMALIKDACHEASINGSRPSPGEGVNLSGAEAVSFPQLLAAKSEAIAAKNALIETQRQQLSRREAEIEQLRQENERLLRENEALRTDQLPGQANLNK